MTRKVEAYVRLGGSRGIATFARDLFGRHAAVEVGEGAHVHLHELTPGLAAGERCRDRVALDHVLLVEKLNVPVGVVLVPGVEDVANDLDVVLWSRPGRDVALRRSPGGDAQWIPLGADGDAASEGPPPFRSTGAATPAAVPPAEVERDRAFHAA